MGVRFACTAWEAGRILKQQDIDVLVLNISDLQADGLQLLQSIKTNRSLTEVITLTMPSSINWSIKTMKLGVYADLLIPFDTEDLAEKIRTACARKKRMEKTGRSLMAKFDDMMTAATFAEAGEIESARVFLKGTDKLKKTLPGKKDEDEKV